MGEDDLAGQRWLWSLGDYRDVARHLWPISVDLVEAAGIAAGQRVLDVAIGDGNTALCALGVGADVVGVDISPAQLDLARARFAAEGVDVELHEGTVEALEFADGEFDAVVSCMGAIFAPDHEAAAAELVRTCRPGGTVAITSWVAGGWLADVGEQGASFLPAPPAGSSPDEWGDADLVASRFAAVDLDVTVAERDFAFTFASVDDAVAFFSQAVPPVVALRGQAEQVGEVERLDRLIAASLAADDRATDGTCAIPSPYLMAVGRR